MRLVRNAKILSVALLIVVLTVVGFAIGVKIGVHMGVHQFVLQEGSVRAARLVGELRVLRDKDAQKLIPAKELELDAEILKALAFRESGLPWLLWPFDSAYEHDRYLRTAAAYRAQHPSFVPEVPIGDDHVMANDLHWYAQRVRERTEELLRDYGQ